MGCSLLFAVQITSLVASIFGVVISVYSLVASHSWEGIIRGIYVLFFSACLFLVEIYIPPCFRFFGFLLKNWGKGATYLILGFIFFSKDTLNTITSIVFWVLAVLYFVLSFVAKGIAKPLAQSTITLSTSNADYYVEA